MTGSNVAQDQIKAYVDRILRMKEEADAIAADIREIYAEAKANGFDKTQLGNLVTYLRKKDKDAEKVAEGEAIFDLYLTAYLGASGKVGTKPATHTYAPDRPDPLAALRADPALSIVDASKLKKSEPQPTKAAGQAQEDAGSFSDQLVPSLPGVEGAEDRETIHEPQPAPQAGSDLDNSQALNGQVATHPEAKTSTDGGATEQDREMPADSVTGEVSRASVGAGSDASNSEPAREGGSQSQEAAGPGRDAAAPSSGEAQPKYAAPGIVTYENHPPEGVERSAISIAFGNMGQDGALIQDDLANGRAQPIVKQGNVILDGWARYMTARTMTELDGSPLTYAVVQYDGTDPLIDVIRWNVEGRMLNEQQKRVIAQTLTRQHPKRKDDIYRAFELWMEPV